MKIQHNMTMARPIGNHCRSIGRSMTSSAAKRPSISEILSAGGVGRRRRPGLSVGEGKTGRQPHPLP